MGCKCSTLSTDVHSNISNRSNNNSNRHLDHHLQQRAREQGSQNRNVVIQNNNRNIDNDNSNRILTNQQRNIDLFLQTRCNPNFNFTIIEDQHLGEGLKKIKGFISIIPKEEIDKKRMAFWGTRVEGNQETWQMLQQICEDKELCDGNIPLINSFFIIEDIKAYLSVGGLVPYKNCINVVFDSFGSLYEIPNYCIHYPSKYNLPEEFKKKPKEMTLRFFVRQTIDQITINTSNYMLTNDLKKEICDKFPNLPDKERSSEKIRLFFGGKELKDEKELWVYNISNDAIIQFMLRN